VILGAGSTSARTSNPDAGEMFSFSDKKDTSAFLKFVEDGVVTEKSLQRVRILH